MRRLLPAILLLSCASAPQRSALDEKYEKIRRHPAWAGPGAQEVLRVAYETLREGKWKHVGLEDLVVESLQEGRILFEKPEKRWGPTTAAETKDFIGQTTIGPWQITITNIRNTYGAKYGVDPKWTDGEIARFCAKNPRVQAAMICDYIEGTYARYGRRSPYAIQAYFWLEPFVKGESAQGPWDESVLKRPMKESGFYAKQIVCGHPHQPYGLLYWLGYTEAWAEAEQVVRAWSEAKRHVWATDHAEATKEEGGFGLQAEDLKHVPDDLRVALIERLFGPSLSLSLFSIEKHPSSGGEYAAELLDRTILKMIAIDLPKIARTQVLTLELGSPSGDWFSISQSGKRVSIRAGNERSLIYASLAFLERLGCRWFTKDAARVPKVGEMLPMGMWTEKAAFEYREDFYTEAFDGDFAARLRSNGHHARLEAKHGGKITYWPFVHTFASITQDPQFFAEVNGQRIADQLCLSKPGLVDVAVAWVKTAPKDATILSISQNDNQNYCRCADCAKMEPSEAILKFVNAVAAHFPDRLIDTLAYQYSRRPPKNVVPAKNVRVRLCSIECCFSHPLEGDCPRNRAFRDDLVAWSKVTDNLYIWDYVTNFAHYLLPFPNLRVLAPNLRFFATHGVKGVFEEGNYSPGGGGEMADLRAYLIGKLLWDPWLDPEALIREFTDGVYGEHAAAVREYIALLHDRAKPHCVGIYDGPTSAYLGGDFLEKAEAILTNAPRKLRLPLEYLRIARGDRSGFDSFKAACKELGITHINEWQELEAWK